VKQLCLGEAASFERGIKPTQIGSAWIASLREKILGPDFLMNIIDALVEMVECYLRKQIGRLEIDEEVPDINGDTILSAEQCTIIYQHLFSSWGSPSRVSTEPCSVEGFVYRLLGLSLLEQNSIIHPE
jgi:hypothetical protein